MTEPNDTVKLDPEVYRAAAKWMAEHGMCKGRLHTEDGRVCILGAIVSTLTVPTSLFSDRVFTAYKDDLSQRVLAAGLRQGRTLLSAHPVVRFNDHPATRQTEVEKFLLQSADDLEVGR
jgi:hypothetical protein